MKAAIYCRVSTEDQEREGTSLETQAEACLVKARELGCEVPEEYVFSETWTGADMDRPGLSKLREMVRQQLFDCVICFATDRLARNPIHIAIIAEPLGNFLDIWPAVMKHGAGKAYSIALSAVMNDQNVDGVIGIATAPVIPEFSFLDVSEALNDIIEELPRKPVLFWLYGPNPEEIGERFEFKKRIMTYPSLEMAVWSLSLLRDRHSYLDRENNKLWTSNSVI